MRRSSAVAWTGAAVLAGCAPTLSRPATARIVVLPSRQLTISTVRAEDRATFILVRGHVGRRAMTRGAVWGHLHLEAWGGRAMLACADTLWTQWHRRGLTYSFFRAAIKAPPSQIDEIRISHASSNDPCPSGMRP